MKVYCRGNSPVISRKEIKYAAKFMSSLIMSHQLTSRLNIFIEFIDNIIDGDTGKQIMGDCMWTDDNTSPREFKICINSKIRKKTQLITLSHELVHVKQYASGETKDVIRGPSNVKWKKQYIHEHKIHYYDLPWEIEAHGREKGMYIRYLEHLKKEKIKFE